MVFRTNADKKDIRILLEQVVGDLTDHHRLCVFLKALSKKIVKSYRKNSIQKNYLEPFILFSGHFLAKKWNELKSISMNYC